MGSAAQTKERLAEGLKELSETVPFHRIRVGELCRRCQMDRRTFYYHFRDIYDLAAWIFNQTLEGNLPDREGRFTLSGMTKVLTRLSGDPVFYRRALLENSQNALGRHIMTSNTQMYEQAVKQLQGRESLSPEDSFAIQYHSIGSLAMLRRWMFSDCTPPAEEMARRLASVMPPVLRTLYGLNKTEEEDGRDE